VTTIPTTPFRFVKVYAPSKTNRGLAKDGQIRKTPQEFVSQFPIHPHKIVVGDFNTIKDSVQNRTGIPPQRDVMHQSGAPLFDQFGIVNTAPPAPRDEDDNTQEMHFTLITNTVDYTLMTRIDYIFVSQELVENVTSYSATLAPITMSDHRLVSATISSSPSNHCMCEVDKN